MKNLTLNIVEINERKLFYLTKYYYFDMNLVGDKPTFLLIGAYTVRILKKMLSLYPEAKIVIYEAEPSVYQEFSQIPFDGDVKFVRKALSRKDETIEIFKYSEEEASSVFKIGRRKPKAVNTVEGQTLSTILNEHGIEKLDCLLMNCEGGELFALEQIASDASLRSKISQVVTCYHDDHTNVYTTEVKEEYHNNMLKTHEVFDSRRGKINYYLYNPR